MRLKAIKHIAVGALALSGVFASAASADEYGTHTVKTPTGLLQVPDVLRGTERAPDGTAYEWKVSQCLYAGDEQYKAYTREEIEADRLAWCLREPGTIGTSPGAGTSTKARHTKKKGHSRKSKGIGAQRAH